MVRSFDYLDYLVDNIEIVALTNDIISFILKH